MITADYNGCELRILAHYSQDPVFVAAFKAGDDLHSRVATMMFGKEVSKSVNKDLRDRAKTINFGLVYGMSHYKLADRLGIPEDEAKKLYDRYFELFPGVSKWLASAGRVATSRGYARTIGGRKRFFNLEGVDKDQRQRGAVERKGKNTPIQGTNADITKLALFRLRAAIQAQDLPAMLVNAVHDEVVVECAEGAAEDVKQIVINEMEAAGEFYVKAVPMVVEAEIASSWSKG
jgi:DNA polymerase-1